MPSPAHASSAIAWSVRRASHTRGARPSARCSSGVMARSRNALHSSARRCGTLPWGASSELLHCRAASATAPGQSKKRRGGQVNPAFGDRANRYASERWRMTFVTANMSAGHSRNWPSSGLPDTASHVDDSVGFSLRESIVINARPGLLRFDPVDEGRSQARTPGPRSVVVVRPVRDPLVLDPDPRDSAHHDRHSKLPPVDDVLRGGQLPLGDDMLAVLEDGGHLDDGVGRKLPELLEILVQASLLCELDAERVIFEDEAVAEQS